MFVSNPPPRASCRILSRCVLGLKSYSGWRHGIGEVAAGVGTEVETSERVASSGGLA